MVLNFKPKLSDSLSVCSIESLGLGRVISVFLSKMLNFKPKIPYVA